jgi:hypothetical protein
MCEKLSEIDIGETNLTERFLCNTHNFHNHIMQDTKLKNQETYIFYCLSCSPHADRYPHIAEDSLLRLITHCNLLVPNLPLAALRV